MTQPDDTGTAGGKTFTQADMDRAISDRLRREREATATKYADYDDLKSKAADADKSKTQLDRMADQLAAIEKRAVAAEATNLRNEVARELKLTDRQARRISGSTREELLADGRDLLEDLGIKPGDGDDAGKDDQGDKNGKAGRDGNDGKGETADTGATRGRPREALRSGAPLTEGTPEETNPMKLAALVPRN